MNARPHERKDSVPMNRTAVTYGRSRRNRN